MLQKDYIMRMVEQLARILARVAFNKNLKQYAQALMELDKAMKQLIGLDSKLIDSLTDDGILALIKFESSMDAEKGIIWAELMREKAEVIELRKGFNESFNYYLRALRFYIEALLANELLQSNQYFQRINFIVEKLKLYEIPNHLKYKLFIYYELSGSFSKAEDLLFELINIGYPNIYSEGESFLKRLLEKTDNELSQGNLPREEVEDALLELKKIYQPNK